MRITNKENTFLKYQDFKCGITEERLDEEYESSRFEEIFQIDYTEDFDFDRLEELELAS